MSTSTSATQQLTIAVVGAGGKMGMRVSNNLQRSGHNVFYSCLLYTSPSPRD